MVSKCFDWILVPQRGRCAAGVYPVPLSDFDKDPYLYNCLNGTLDLRTREFRPHSPADMLFIIAIVRYVPEARSELWERVSPA